MRSHSNVSPALQIGCSGERFEPCHTMTITAIDVQGLAGDISRLGAR